MPATYEHLRVHREDALLWVRIDRPHARNALSRAALAEIGGAFAAHAEDAGIKIAVLTGEGDKAFAAGGDLKDFSQVRTAEETRALFDGAYAALERIRSFPVPVVAALNGLAVGGGAELALACDFRVAAATASIGYVQARLGITSGFGGGADLMGRIGASAALLHLLRADVLDAAQALAAGVVDAVASDETLEACVRRFAEPILRAPPQVIRGCKALASAVRRGAPRAELQRLEREAFVSTWTHADHWHAVERMLGRKKDPS